jgi:Concanavalin A-like lectin/glucanases superfamily
MKQYILILILSFLAFQGFSQNKTYEYDELNRLYKAHYFDGATEKYYITYTYDEVGNRMSKVVNVLSVFTGLIAHYPFTGNSNDISGNTNNGTPINGPTLNSGVKGEVNGAYCLDGIDDYINTPIQQNNVTSYSISAWVKTSMVQTAGGNSFVVAQTRGATNQGGRSLTLGYDKNLGRWFFALDTDFIINGTSIQMNNNNQWMHITGTWSGTTGTLVSFNQFKIYINGVLQTSQDYGASSGTNNLITAPISGLGTTKIGYHEGWNSYFLGCIDNVRIYQNQILSNTEITNIYDLEKPCTTPTATLSGTQTITEGQTANLSVTLTGAGPWSIVMNGNTYTANASPFSIPVSPNRSTSYSISSLSNSCGTGTYNGTAVVTVNPCTNMYSLKTGNWNDPTVWSCGRNPLITDNVTINQGHNITIPTFTNASAKDLVLLGSIFYNQGSILQLGTAINLNLNLLAYLPLDGNANDLSGNNNNGIINGATLTTDRFGAANKAYDFNGTSSIDLNSISNSSLTSNFTVSVWVNFNNFLNDYPTILFGENAFFMLQGMGPIYGTNYKKASFYFEPRTVPYNLTVKTNTPLIEGTYYNLILRKNGNNFSLFLNGLLQETQINPNNLVSGSFLKIGGGRNASEALNGKLDNIRIYTRAFTDLEVLYLYNSERP